MSIALAVFLPDAAHDDHGALRNMTEGILHIAPYATVTRLPLIDSVNIERFSLLPTMIEVLLDENPALTGLAIARALRDRFGVTPRARQHMTRVLNNMVREGRLERHRYQRAYYYGHPGMHDVFDMPKGPQGEKP